MSFLPNYECLGSDSGFRAVLTHVVWGLDGVVRGLCVSTTVESSFSEAECAWQVQRFVCCPVRGLNTPPCSVWCVDAPPRCPFPAALAGAVVVRFNRQPIWPGGFWLSLCVLAIEPDPRSLETPFVFGVIPVFSLFLFHPP